MNKKTITEKLLPLVTPGAILLKEFMEPLGLTPYRVAKDIGATPTAIGQIVNGVRSITPDMALRLSSYLGTTPQFWLNAQSHYDLRKIERQATDRPVIARCTAYQTMGIKLGARQKNVAA